MVPKPRWTGKRALSRDASHRRLVLTFEERPHELTDVIVTEGSRLIHGLTGHAPERILSRRSTGGPGAGIAAPNPLSLDDSSDPTDEGRRRA